ncbi:MAG: tyrosine-type recombinase/integrase [Elusimicrobiota bacterium]|jgi:integrase/recombinase XerD
MDRLNIASITPQTLNWDTAARMFLLRCKSLNLSQPTIDLYAVRLRLFRAWVAENGNLSPGEIQSPHLRAFLDHCKERGNKPTTVACIFKILRTFWHFLHRDGLIILDPMEKVEHPRRERRFLKPITVEELRRILEVIDTGKALGLRDHSLILFLADTGLRISEALSVKLSEIDWGSNTIAVMGKGGKERRIAFGSTARHALMLWMRKRGTVEGCDSLWIDRFGRTLKRTHFAHRMKRYTRTVGIAADRLSPHALRHFFALQFLRNGGDIMALQKLLGHSSLDMVRNYVNMTDDDALTEHRRASPLDKMGPLPGERKRVRLD